jgi:hypothetical protein
MGLLLMQKFTRHPQLARELVGTGDAELVEGNTWGDEFWGVCNGRGSNQLGRLLMEVRALLRSLEASDRLAAGSPASEPGRAFARIFDAQEQSL